MNQAKQERSPVSPALMTKHALSSRGDGDREAMGSVGTSRLGAWCTGVEST
jgi:hypothetical protein